MHPILFSVWIFTIYSFGTLLAVGYLFAAFLLFRDARRRGKDPASLLDLGTGLLLSGLLGARLLYIFLHLEEYLEDPLEVFRLQRGGLVFYGGLAAAVVFAILFIQRKRLPLWQTLDEIVPYATLVQAFGRIGCFLNGCCYGKPTLSRIGILFPGHPVPLHPTQLYESFSLFILFILFRSLAQKRALPVGRLFVLYLFSYGLLRFIVEFFRGDQDLWMWGWTLPQGVSLFLIGLSLMLWKRGLS
ncbi:MAG: prolipoprotein diacylglyceryl transferase [Candidatus Omnitrophica bacterium]|nr:prolipoprotein diacylglyceryl transferase [Candidatus Omnitrophota bacterium]